MPIEGSGTGRGNRERFVREPRDADVPAGSARADAATARNAARTRRFADPADPMGAVPAGGGPSARVAAPRTRPSVRLRPAQGSTETVLDDLWLAAELTPRTHAAGRVAAARPFGTDRDIDGARRAALSARDILSGGQESAPATGLGAMLDALDDIGRRVRALAEGPPVRAADPHDLEDALAPELPAAPAARPRTPPTAPIENAGPSLERQLGAISARLDRLWQSTGDDLRVLRSGVGAVKEDIGDLRSGVAALAARLPDAGTEARVLAQLEAVIQRQDEDHALARQSEIALQGDLAHLAERLDSLARASADIGLRIDTLSSHQEEHAAHLGETATHGDVVRLEQRLGEMARALEALAGAVLHNDPQQQLSGDIADLAGRLAALEEALDGDAVSEIAARAAESAVEALGERLSASLQPRLNQIAAEVGQMTVARAPAPVAPPAPAGRSAASAAGPLTDRLRDELGRLQAAVEQASRTGATPSRPAPAPAQPVFSATAPSRAPRPEDAVRRARAAVSRVAALRAAPSPAGGRPVAPARPDFALADLDAEIGAIEAAQPPAPVAEAPSLAAPVAEAVTPLAASPRQEPESHQPDSIAPEPVVAPPAAMAPPVPATDGALSSLAAISGPAFERLSRVLTQARGHLPGLTGQNASQPAGNGRRRALRAAAAVAVLVAAIAIIDRDVRHTLIAALDSSSTPTTAIAAAPTPTEAQRYDDAAIRNLAARMVANAGPATADDPSDPVVTGSAGTRAAPFAVTSSDSVDNSTNLPDGIPESLRSAALSGDRYAAYDVAMRFVDGVGLPANPAMAADWFRRAALAGDARAAFRFGSMLERGTGVDRDLAQARTFYEQAAGAGNVLAMHNLAVLMSDGSGGPKDLEAAARWFQAAADHGVVDSQFNLGVLYLRGTGVQQDSAIAYKWFSLAAAGNDEQARVRRDTTAERLDKATRQKVDDEVTHWTPVPADPFANAVQSRA